MKYLQHEFGRLKTAFVFVLFLIADTVAQQLDCNFDQKHFCNWSNGINGVEDDFDWQLDDTVPVDGFHSIPRTITGSGYFAFAQGRFRPFESDAARAWLRSPTLDGTSRPATLSFVYWKTAVPPVLQVCTRDAGDTRLRCLDTISGLGEQRWVQRIITIPGNTSPFQIVFVATGFRTALDLIGIDDITFRYGTYLNEEKFKPKLPGIQFRNLNYQRRNSDSASGDIDDRSTASIIYSTLVLRAGGFTQQGPVEFETYRPIYNRVQNTFEYFTDDNIGPVFTTPLPFLEPAGRFVHERNQIPNVGVTGRPEVFFLAQTRFYGEIATTNRSMYTHTEPPPHVYFTTPHAYSKSTHHLYQTTEGGSGESEEPYVRQCDAVTCFFDNGLCFWYNDLKANFDWKMKAADAVSRGIPNDTSDRLSYAFVSGETRKQEQRAALRSPIFRLQGNSYLDFTVFISDTTSGHLAVKSNDYYGDKVLWETYGYKNLGGNGWNRVRVALPSVKYPIMLIFEVNQMSSGQYVGIDDLRLTDDAGGDVGCYFNATMYRTTATPPNYHASTTEHSYQSTEHQYQSTENPYQSSEHQYESTEHQHQSSTEHQYQSSTEHQYQSTEHQYASTTKHQYDSTPSYTHHTTPGYKFHVGYETTTAEPDRDAFQRAEGNRPTFIPVFHRVNNQQNNLLEPANLKKLNEEISVDVLGEHGGSIIDPERVDAWPTTTELIFGINTDGFPSQFYGDVQSDVTLLNDNQNNKFQNLIQRTGLNTSLNNSTKLSDQTSIWRRFSNLPINQAPKQDVVGITQTTANPDPLGVGDFVRRVSSDLGSYLGLNRQSYIFGADVFNRYPKTGYQLNDNSWLSHIFGKK